MPEAKKPEEDKKREAGEITRTQRLPLPQEEPDRSLLRPERGQ